MVISDIDDTVIRTGAGHLLHMARTVFLGNARTRLPFKGAAAFYRALFNGQSGSDQNLLFYTSSSPWNLYDLLSDFFHLHNIPNGPVLLLRDWGITDNELLPIRNRMYKLQAIRKLLDLFPALPCILVGDSGQEDPEIYTEITTLYPQRIMAVYIRNVSAGTERPNTIRKLAEKVISVGSTLVLADGTLPLAEHAASQGWISPEALPGVAVDEALDEQRPAV
jgi:phosphatidate phosphatase APP1